MTWRRLAVALGLALCVVPAEAVAGSDGDEISRSRGKKGGAVVLWPRVVPETEDGAMQQLASQLQQRMSAAAARQLGERPVDVRPAPERVCPQSGCKGVSVGVVLGHESGGCVAVALVSAPGPEPQRLVTYAGVIDLFNRDVQFRAPPENKFEVTEFVPCTELIQRLDDSALETAIAEALPID